MKNISHKEILRAFIELTEDLTSRGIIPVFHFMDNEASTALNMTMTSMNIKYQLVIPINNIAKDAERESDKNL